MHSDLQLHEILSQYCSEKAVGQLDALLDGDETWSVARIDALLDACSDALAAHGLDSRDEPTAEGRKIENCIDPLLKKRYKLEQN